ncbi:hypothetical protein M409DRAFT_25356 [Zasmidium cellare ATCC 36951]|uniref:gamma-glutamylcyclotransferase n=1 Tax=Zasmidium cellare ATCC 36951 TaxID=1080233 RepID=A0A6A6CE84_ZASCE|nr:uncharacterized protein M409DRAFT_25356 [Zasmidium cellare ATCC 36951]KAF2164478.1 hypothetical protein M409DRAFT_25356 [Zasmidium cellare ATCC 36951]
MSKRTVYFGYGSNLWRHQMRKRCPTSKYLGIARLKSYKWIIYDRGYANIVEIKDDEDKTIWKHDYRKEVWGLVYSLEPSDEARLDVNEGVPIAYTKEWIECEFWPTSESNDDAFASEQFPNELESAKGKPDTSKEPKKVEMLVYINREGTDGDNDSKKEYIYRMNMGIKDALKEGMPNEYVKQVLREYIPEREDEEVVEVAKRQALDFQDEN